MTPEEELRKAGEARQLLEHPIFKEARARVEGFLAESRRTVPIRDVDMHTRLILMEQLWDNLTSYFEQLAQTGKFAEMHLREQERRKSLLEQGVLMFRNLGRTGL